MSEGSVVWWSVVKKRPVYRWVGPSDGWRHNILKIRCPLVEVGGRRTEPY